ncbi:MAG: 3-deoxy-D-manno-octulosonic acid transferase [Candidatus Cloacimonadales bacterium]|jgi:3-deoxy-D-manno-octulosonic-acid transferase|nr:3-deoxy-D-manno-octulosonic acid transferase [Candidatus Cloacimonadota bacterium]MDD2650530.1 3-deoxy-D-manno-octulosonic acid transferase [Candidatus Cloacimonadota bacterium]MDX9976907.1 3-deoxy-D-manno-octulosonic acid transferase [Candidatus Cloacimonadales bacterium]
MFIYNLFLRIAYIVFFPILYFLFRNNNFKQRFRIKELSLTDTIWIHASSIGEVNAVKPLLLKLIRLYPRRSFVMTCMTKTGLENAKKINNKLTVLPFPFDMPHIIKRFVRVIDPSLIILVETEIWPNLINIAYKNKIPVAIVNGRISDKSYPRYHYTRFFWKNIFKKIMIVNAQSEKDSQRFKSLGSKNVLNSNNLKFSCDFPEYDKSELRKAWGFSFNDIIISFGSTRPGEEKIIIDLARQLKHEIPRLKIIVVPRHLHRINEVKKLLKRHEYSLFSENIHDRLITIVDEMGILTQVYALSDIAIIGGSFSNFGGHNPLEAAAYKNALIIGQYHQSCRDIVEKLHESNGIIIADENSLHQEITRLMSNIEIRKMIGNNAFNVIEANKNSIDLHINNLQEVISMKEIV